MEPDLKILTSRQRRVYQLRQEGLTFKAIGERLGIHSSAAAVHMRLAERRLREYDRFQKAEAWNKQAITVTMSQGALRALIEGLQWWLGELRWRGNAAGAMDGKWLGRLPYQMQVVKEFAEQLQIDLYGEAGCACPGGGEGEGTGGNVKSM